MLELNLAISMIDLIIILKGYQISEISDDDQISPRTCMVDAWIAVSPEGS